MVKIFLMILISILFSVKSFAASNNLFFTTAQLMTYCKSNNLYEQGVCDGYIISVSDVLYTLDKKAVQVCIPENTSIKSIRLSVINFIIDNAQLMSIEANKTIGQFFVNAFQCKK
tara:strand:- start:24 stop:368 length:345 start_codon:yes stop_codon:yes gene_type:complete